MHRKIISGLALLAQEVPFHPDTFSGSGISGS